MFTLNVDLKDLRNYSLALVGITIVAIIAIKTVVHCWFDEIPQNQVLNVMSAIGSLLSGIAAIGATSAAFIALNAWLRQIKVGKYLACIWDAKIEFTRFKARWCQWYLLKYDERNKDDSNIDYSDEELEKIHNNLISACISLDSIVTKEVYSWNDKSQELKCEWFRVKEYLENNPKPHNSETLLIEHESLPDLRKSFFKLIDDLLQELEELEKQYN